MWIFKQEIFAKLFSLDGLGWGILFFIFLFLGSMWIWFVDKKNSYEKVIVKKMNRNEFDDFLKEQRVELYDSHEINSTSPSYYWVFGCEEKPLEIKLLKMLENPPVIEDFSAKNFEKQMFEQVQIRGQNKISLEPDEYAAFFLETNSGTSMPVFKVKLKMNGRLCTYDLVANMRYGSTGDRRTILKFEQTFRSFLKNRVSQIFNLD